MTLQQWCFSFSGRLGRRDFWLWIGVWLVLMVALFIAAAQNWLALRSAAFGIVALLWPTAAVVVKRLHDRNRSGGWIWLLLAAWMLAAGNWSMFSPWGPWGLGRTMPTLMVLLLLVDCGLLLGTPGENRFGPPAQPVRLRDEALRPYLAPLPIVFAGHMARTATQMLGHMPLIFEALLGIPDHLRVAA